MLYEGKFHGAGTHMGSTFSSSGYPIYIDKEFVRDINVMLLHIGKSVNVRVEAGNNYSATYKCLQLPLRPDEIAYADKAQYMGVRSRRPVAPS